jgi:RecA/RadA recombinase
MAVSAARIAEILAGLRASSARLRTGAELARAHVPFGVPALDRALRGGMPRGKLVELTGARSSGRLSLAVGAIAQAQREGELVALVDVADAFDPRTATDVTLHRLLWVRAHGWLAGLKAADRIHDAGGFGLVVLYACGASAAERLRSSVWTRLTKRAESARAAVLIVGDRAQAGSFAVATLEARRGRARFSGLFDGVASTVVVVRNKLGQPGEVAEVERAAG